MNAEGRTSGCRAPADGRTSGRRAAVARACLLLCSLGCMALQVAPAAEESGPAERGGEAMSAAAATSAATPPDATAPAAVPPAAAPAPAAAPPSAPSAKAPDGVALPEPWPQSPTIDDLLKAEQGARHPEAGAKPAALTKGVRVRAIYGVGRHLMADVWVDGELLRFRSGQRLPRRREARAVAPYELLRIEPPCVVLQHENAPVRACMLGAPDGPQGE